MSNLNLGAKVLIINDADDFPLKSYTKQADGSLKEDAVFSDAADRIAISGFAEFDKLAVKSLIRGLGVAGRPQKGTITFGGDSIVAGDEIYVKIKVTSENLEQEFENSDGTYVREHSYQLVVKAGDDAADLAARLKALIDKDVEQGRNIVTATVDSAVVTYEGRGNGLSYDVTAEGAKITSGGITVVHAVTEAPFEGRNTWLQLNRLRLQTPNRVYPYSLDTKELPLKGAKYTSFLFTKGVKRPDLHGGTTVNELVAAEFQYEIYVNETLTTYITNLTAWADKSVPVVLKYNANTPALALATPEIVVDKLNKLVQLIVITSAGDATTISTDGGTLQLTANITPSDANNATVSWASSDVGIATVDATGKVTAVADGVVVITATAKDGSGVKDQFTITISNQE